VRTRQIATTSQAWKASGRNAKSQRSTRCGCCRVCLQTLANRSRERRIYGEIFSWIYLEENRPRRRWLPTERTVCRHSKPIQFADDSALLSGNYFRALGKRVSRLSSPFLPFIPARTPPKGRRIRAHSQSIATGAHIHIYIYMCTHTRLR